MTYKLYKEGWYIPSFLLVIVNGMHLELIERKRKCISYINSLYVYKVIQYTKFTVQSLKIII